jgi:hypothetical protein
MSKDLFNEHPNLKGYLEKIKKTRIIKTLNDIRNQDDQYKALLQERVEASDKLREALSASEFVILFERYSDAIYSVEAYQLESVYERAFMDGTALKENKSE